MLAATSVVADTTPDLARTHCHLGIIFLGGWFAEHSFKTITHETSHPTTMCIDRSGQALQTTIHDLQDLIRFKALTQHGRSNDINK